MRVRVRVRVRVDGEPRRRASVYFFWVSSGRVAVSTMYPVTAMVSVSAGSQVGGMKGWVTKAILSSGFEMLLLDGKLKAKAKPGGRFTG